MNSASVFSPYVTDPPTYASPCEHRKGLEEVEGRKRTLELESQVALLKNQVKEYEVKLAEVMPAGTFSNTLCPFRVTRHIQALPLLESLDQQRSEVRETRRKHQSISEEAEDLRSKNKTLSLELAECRIHAERSEAARMELEKQLESEREESQWLSEVEARQMKEMEAKCEELQKRAAEDEVIRAEAKVNEQHLRQQVRELERQASHSASAKDLNLRSYVAQLQAGHNAMEAEVAALRKELTAASSYSAQAFSASISRSA